MVGGTPKMAQCCSPRIPIDCSRGACCRLTWSSGWNIIADFIFGIITSLEISADLARLARTIDSLPPACAARLVWLSSSSRGGLLGASLPFLAK